MGWHVQGSGYAGYAGFFGTEGEMPKREARNVDVIAQVVSHLDVSQRGCGPAWMVWTADRWSDPTSGSKFNTSAFSYLLRILDSSCSNS